jgi:hypothetical protein
VEKGKQAVLFVNKKNQKNFIMLVRGCLAQPGQIS